MTLGGPYKDEQFFQVFGHIAVFFATLDTVVTLILLRLVHPDRRVKAVTMNDRTTLQQKFVIIKDLKADQVNNPALLGELQALIPTALTIGERRNRFTHDLWLFNSDKIAAGRITRLRVKELPNWKFDTQEEEEITLEGLYHFLGEIGKLQSQFGGFLGRLPLDVP